MSGRLTAGTYRFSTNQSVHSRSTAWWALRRPSKASTTSRSRRTRAVRTSLSIVRFPVPVEPLRPMAALTSAAWITSSPNCRTGNLEVHRRHRTPTSQYSATTSRLSSGATTSYRSSKYLHRCLELPGPVPPKPCAARACARSGPSPSSRDRIHSRVVAAEMNLRSEVSVLAAVGVAVVVVVVVAAARTGLPGISFATSLGASVFCTGRNRTPASRERPCASSAARRRPTRRRCACSRCTRPRPRSRGAPAPAPP